MNKQNLSFVCLIGPTSSGKTACLEHLPAGRVEVISADSMQIYRGMDIGTAKPSKELQAQVPHHLINILNPDESYHVAEFVRRCNILIPQIHARGHIPLIVGGTAFYIKTLLYGVPETPAPDIHIRNSLQQELQNTSLQAMYKKLQKIDAISAARIHPADTYRIMRALEIYYSSGKPRSSFIEPEAKKAPSDITRIAGIYMPRATLRERIYARVDAMFQAGLPQEVFALMEQGYTQYAPGMRGIGYREFWRYKCFPHLSELQRTDILVTVQERISYNSLQYAKRQMVFFTRMHGIEWFNYENISAFCDYLLT